MVLPGPTPSPLVHVEVEVKRYKLPDALGGGEVEANELWSGCAGARHEYLLADGLTVTMPLGQELDEVEPPLPKEPRAWSVVAVVDPTAVLTIPPAIIFQRWTSGWFRAGYDEKHEWPEVCALGTPTVIWTTDGDS